MDLGLGSSTRARKSQSTTSPVTGRRISQPGPSSTVVDLVSSSDEDDDVPLKTKLPLPSQATSSKAALVHRRKSSDLSHNTPSKRAKITASPQSRFGSVVSPQRANGIRNVPIDASSVVSPVRSSVLASPRNVVPFATVGRAQQSRSITSAEHESADSLDADDDNNTIFKTLSSPQVRSQKVIRHATPTEHQHGAISSIERQFESYIAPTSTIMSEQLQQLRVDTAYTTRAQLKRARMNAPPRLSDPTSKVAAGIFARMKPRAISAQLKKSDLKVLQTETWTSAHKSVKVAVRAPINRWNLTPKKAMPRYAHVVRMRESTLSSNEIMLSCWPYFGDEHEPNTDDFEMFKKDISYRDTKLERLHTARWVYETCEAALVEAKLQWSDILGYLFCDEEHLDNMLGDGSSKNRESNALDFEFPEDASRWTSLNQKIGTISNLERAAEFSILFMQMTGLSIWHLLRRSEIVKDALADPEEEVTDLISRMCGLCLRYDCLVHGEIEESAEKDAYDDSSESDAVDDADTVNPRKKNFHKRIALVEQSSVPGTIPRKRKTKAYWDNKNVLRPDAMGPFRPCHHPDQSCEQAACSCFEAQIMCEKYCSCPLDCPRKFQGCDCATNTRKGMICFNDDSCACFAYGRECDPDLCSRCDVHGALNINNTSEALTKCCRNASIQRDRPRHTVLGASPVHAFGLFACETILAEEFVGEYKGEIITKSEADRRGAVYAQQKLSYLFTLNKEQEVDSTYSGNKIRFINHDDGSQRNVYARVMLVDTRHRIALHAERKIEAGEELFFDYGPTFPESSLGGKKKITNAPMARNQQLLKGFVNPAKVNGKLKKIGGKNGSSGTNTPR